MLVRGIVRLKEGTPVSYLFIILLTLLVGCAGTSGRTTLVADHAIASTQIVDLRQSATVNAARMQTTIDFMGTRIRSREENRELMLATLIARGTDAGFLVQSQGNAEFVPPTATPRPTDALLAAAEDAPTPIGGSGIIPDTADTGAALTDIVTAPGVLPDDCAQSPTSQFTTNTAEIYVVARAQNISSGTTLTSRWLQEGTEVATFDFTPDFEIDDACIWFFIDQSDVTFISGTWSVALDINGAQVGMVDFDITEP